MTALTVERLTGFADPTLPSSEWDALLAGDQRTRVFLTHAYQRAWWASFGRGTLLLLVARRAGRAVAIAPFFADGGMVFPVGSGGSDYLDLIGDVGDVEAVAALLGRARDEAPDFVGFRLYHLSGASQTPGALRAAGPRLGLDLFDEGGLPAPAVDLREDPAAARLLPEKESLVRRERALRRDGSLEVEHLSDGRAIAPHLDALFEQHVARWDGTGSPSLFEDPFQRAFYRVLAREAADAGWLRFTRVDFEGRAVALHFGFSFGGRYLWYKPTYDLASSHRSPGQVLLRHLMLAALDEGAHTFDFGLGDEAFKARFATHVDKVRTFGLYPARGGPRG